MDSAPCGLFVTVRCCDAAVFAVGCAACCGAAGALDPPISVKAQINIGNTVDTKILPGFPFGVDSYEPE